jgi:hypothetical protein
LITLLSPVQAAEVKLPIQSTVALVAEVLEDTELPLVFL